MFRVVVGFSNASPRVLDELTNIVNKRLALDEPRIWWPLNREEVEAWFLSELFDPRSFAVVELGSRVLGFAWAYRAKGLCMVSLDIDPTIPRHVAVEGVRYLLSWAGLHLGNTCRSDVVVAAGLEHGYRHGLLKLVLDAPTALKFGGTLMVFAGRVEDPRLPRGYRVREGGLEDSESVSRVFNEAFSRYCWFYPWTPRDVRTYLERSRPRLFVAESSDGEIAGFAMTKVRKSFAGLKIGYLDVVAVRPKHQRRGLGKALVFLCLNALLNEGVDLVAVDSASGVEPLYARLGFLGYRRYVRLRTSALSLKPWANAAPLEARGVEPRGRYPSSSRLSR